MNWIEIMGPSGIGKSFFLNVIVKNRKTTADWVLLKEGLLEIAINQSKNDFGDKLLKAYLNQPFVNNKKDFVTTILLNKKEAYLKEAWKYQEMVQQYLNFHCCNSNSDSIEKAYRISLFKSIIEDLCVFDFKEYRKLVILDEGPFNHLPDMEKLDPNLIRLPKGLIFCDLDVETNFKRIKSREKDRGKPSPIHIGLNDDELKTDIFNRRDAFLKKKEILLSYGIPYIDVNLNNVNEETVASTSSFLTLCSKK